jgi:uncharacterized YccA/Bax inhibitor family protein
MQSNNPVFNRVPEFNGQASSNAYGNQTYPGAGATYPGYGQQPYSDPSTWGTGGPGGPVATQRLTIDAVVQKTTLSLFVVVLAAAATWVLTPAATDANAGTLVAVTMLGMFIGLGLGLYAAFSRKMISPAVVMIYAAAEGVFMGGISKTYEAWYGGGIIVNALIGTVAAFAGMLAAYKIFDIKVGDKFRKGFFAAAMGFLALLMVGFTLQMFGVDTGLFGNGALGLLIAVAGLGFGVVGLLLDFGMVEDAITMGVDERFAWTAAFGLTASIVTIYFYLLRILAILNQE